jgi:hypothetical protein
MATQAQPTHAQQTPASRWHPELFLQGNLAVADEIIAPDFVWHAVGIPDTPLGPAGVKPIVAALRAGVHPTEITDTDVMVQGDRTVFRWTLRGIHQGEVLGIPATGKYVTFSGFDLFRTAGGKLVELWQAWNQLEFLQQVGASVKPG